jgi:hypothetical protein
MDLLKVCPYIWGYAGRAAPHMGVGGTNRRFLNNFNILYENDYIYMYLDFIHLLDIRELLAVMSVGPLHTLISNTDAGVRKARVWRE